MKNIFEVSVIISVYNKPFQLVKRAIDSVIKQDFNDSIEIVVVDDGSSMDLSTSLLLYIVHLNGTISYMRHTNCGQAESLNKAISLSKGKHIALLDADDEYKKEHVSTCMSHMNRYDLISSPTQTIVNSDEDYYFNDKNDINKLVHIDDCVVMGTLFGKRNVFESIPFNKQYALDARFHEEALRLLGDKKVGRTNQRTYIYHRDVEESICKTLKNAAKEAA